MFIGIALEINNSSSSRVSNGRRSTWYEADNISIQNCIIAEPLYFSSHLEGTIEGHSKGAFFGHHSTDITFYRNIIAHSADRNPYCLTTYDGFRARFQIVNNLIYNWVYFGAAMGSDSGLTEVDFIGNYLKQGPDTRTYRYELLLNGDPKTNTHIYIEDNLGHHRTTTNNANTEWSIAGLSTKTQAPETYRSFVRFTQEVVVPILPVMAAYDTLLLNSGANLGLAYDCGFNSKGVYEKVSNLLF